MRPYTRDAVEADLRRAMAREEWDTVDTLSRQLDVIDTGPRRATGVGAALWYATHGVPVFPITPGAKTPLPGSRGVHDATTDPQHVKEWWTTHPDANIGLATGHHFDVIDFDGTHAHTAWSEKYGTGWDTAGVDVLATVTTPRPGGLHVYVPATGDGNYAGLVPGVDYRGLGGYVLAPPSSTPQGTYQFLRPLHL